MMRPEDLERFVDENVVVPELEVRRDRAAREDVTETPQIESSRASGNALAR